MTPNFLGNLLDQVAASSTILATAMLKTALHSAWLSLYPYLPYLILLFFVLLVIATIKFFAFGDWSALGSLIYHVIYFGILAIIIAVKGLDIVFSPAFDFIYALLYPVSYWLTGQILRQLGAKARYR